MHIANAPLAGPHPARAQRRMRRNDPYNGAFVEVEAPEVLRAEGALHVSQRCRGRTVAPFYTAAADEASAASPIECHYPSHHRRPVTFAFDEACGDAPSVTHTTQRCGDGEERDAFLYDDAVAATPSWRLPCPGLFPGTAATPVPATLSPGAQSLPSARRVVHIDNTGSALESTLNAKATAAPFSVGRSPANLSTNAMSLEASSPCSSSASSVGYRCIAPRELPVLALVSGDRQEMLKAPTVKLNKKAGAATKAEDAFADHYKTRLCVNYQKDGSCRYGRVCRFAHGSADVRTYAQNVREGITSVENLTAFLRASRSRS